MWNLLKLINPSFWMGLALVFIVSNTGSFLYGEHRQKHLDDLEKAAEVAAANQKARRNEQKLQESVDAAATVAAKREKKLLADANSARQRADSLRDSEDALKRASEKSLSNALEALGLTTGLLNRCTKEYLGMAENAQRADSEARELREAWPK